MVKNSTLEGSMCASPQSKYEKHLSGNIDQSPWLDSFKGPLAACDSMSTRSELGPWRPPPSRRHTDCQLWHQIVLVSRAGGRLQPGTGQTAGIVNRKNGSSVPSKAPGRD